MELVHVTSHYSCSCLFLRLVERGVSLKLILVERGVSRKLLMLEESSVHELCFKVTGHWDL